MNVMLKPMKLLEMLIIMVYLSVSVAELLPCKKKTQNLQLKTKQTPTENRTGKKISAGEPRRPLLVRTANTELDKPMLSLSRQDVELALKCAEATQKHHHHLRIHERSSLYYHVSTAENKGGITVGTCKSFVPPDQICP